MLKYVTNEIINISGPKREQASSGLGPTDSQGSPAISPAPGLAAKPRPELPEAQDLSLARLAASQCVKAPVCRSWTEQGSVASSLYPSSSLSQPIPILVYLAIRNKKKNFQKRQQVGHEGSHALDEHKELIVVLVDHNSYPALPPPRQSLFLPSMFKTI